MGRQEKDEDVVELMRNELKNCRGEWFRLARLTNRKISYRWIVGFVSGEIKKPSFERIELLGRYIGIRLKVVSGPHFAKFKPE